MRGGFVIEPLGAWDRSAFACGTAALDRYLREQASQDIKRLVASCFVAVETATQTLAGYYTLAATSVAASDLSPEFVKRLPRYPLLPAALIGRLAVDQRYQGKGLGSALLADAALRVLRSEMKALALIVEAKDDKAMAFYRFQGFTPFVSRPMSLYLALETFRKGRIHPEGDPGIPHKPVSYILWPRLLPPGRISPIMSSAWKYPKVQTSPRPPRRGFDLPTAQASARSPHALPAPTPAPLPR